MPIAPRPSSPSHAWRRRALGLVAVAALTLGGAACSDDDGGDEKATPTTEADSGGTSDGDTSDGSTTTEAGADPTTPAPETDPDLGPLPELDEVEQPYADALLADEDVTSVFGEVDQECTAVRWVDLIGAERFEASGMTPETFVDEGPGELELDEETATQMVAILEGCGGAMDRVYAGMVESFGGETDDEMLACMKEAVSEDELRAFFVASFQGVDEGLFEELGTRWESCTPAEG